MIKITNTEVFGWEAAIRGMRNPMNSWDKSDTSFWCYPEEEGVAHKIGENDLKLMKTLAKAGSDHGKFLRMINVTVDLNAPLYWWKEFDTYKVGTVANSCSTMHKIQAKEFTRDDFSCDHLLNKSNSEEFDCVGINIEGNIEKFTALGVLDITIEALNHYREQYFKAKHKPMKEESKCAGLMKKQWWQMIQLLPSSYNQLRTVQLNYQVLKTMYNARKNHKLDEWHTFCEWCETLPYFKELCLDE